MEMNIIVSIGSSKDIEECSRSIDSLPLPLFVLFVAMKVTLVVEWIWKYYGCGNSS